jgi:hypothetical protein
MENKILKDVTYIHAAARDCTSSAMVPAMYATGDTVRVDRASGTTVDVELSQVDIAQGNFMGIVKASTDVDVEPGDTISFYFM